MAVFKIKTLVGVLHSRTFNTIKENAMSKKAIFGLVQNEIQASDIVENLGAAGFSNTDISVLFPDKTGARDFAHEKHTKVPEGASAGAGAGLAIGGTLGWIAGIGVLAIPGVGPFIAAGPLMAALSGAAVGGVIGGIAGALIGMGIPEFEAKRYESRIKGGNILISVHTEDSDQADKAKRIFETAGAEDIATAGEAPVSEKDKRLNAITASKVPVGEED